jgi:hypothetical protein
LVLRSSTFFRHLIFDIRHSLHSLQSPIPTMPSAFRDLLALLMPWRANYTPYPVAGPYGVAAGETRVAGAAAGHVFVTGATAGQAHEH